MTKTASKKKAPARPRQDKPEPDHIFSPGAREFFEAHPEQYAPDVNVVEGAHPWRLSVIHNDAHKPIHTEHSEFPLHADPALLRKTLTTQMALWSRSIASLLSRSPTARCVVTRERIYFGTDLPALAWCFLNDWVAELPDRAPSANLRRLAQRLVNKITLPISQRLLAEKRLFTIITRG